MCSFRNLAKTNPHPQDRVQLFDEEFGVKAFMNVGADPAFGGAGAAHGAELFTVLELLNSVKPQGMMAAFSTEAPNQCMRRTLFAGPIIPLQRRGQPRFHCSHPFTARREKPRFHCSDSLIAMPATLQCSSPFEYVTASQANGGQSRFHCSHPYIAKTELANRQDVASQAFILFCAGHLKKKKKEVYLMYSYFRVQQPALHQ